MANKITVILKSDSSLLTSSLYELEPLLDWQCGGHGVGCGGEDIHFYFPAQKTKELSINRSGRKLTISAAMYVRDKWSDIDLADIPSPMKQRLVNLLEVHTQGPIPKELMS